MIILQLLLSRCSIALPIAPQIAARITSNANIVEMSTIVPNQRISPIYSQADSPSLSRPNLGNLVVEGTRAASPVGLTPQTRHGGTVTAQSRDIPDQGAVTVPDKPGPSTQRYIYIENPHEATYMLGVNEDHPELPLPPAILPLPPAILPLRTQAGSTGMALPVQPNNGRRNEKIALGLIGGSVAALVLGIGGTIIANRIKD